MQDGKIAIAMYKLETGFYYVYENADNNTRGM